MQRSGLRCSFVCRPGRLAPGPPADGWLTATTRAIAREAPAGRRLDARPVDLVYRRDDPRQEGWHMAMYWKEITVNWGESDPFGLVYYPRIVAWFNDTEHELFRVIGYPSEQMIKNDRTTFVMGEIHFRFIGPAAYGDRILTTITLADIGEHTLHWNCKAKNAMTGAAVSEGRATRVYARIMEDGTLKAMPIPSEMINAIREVGDLKHLGTNRCAKNT